MASDSSGTGIAGAVEALGRTTVQGLEFLGFGATLFRQALYWTFLGKRDRQPVQLPSVFVQMMEVGIGAVPIVSVLSMTIGIMLAIQGIDVLRPFGAQHQVTIGVSLSLVREFAPLITGIIVAGRSGSALAARIGTMTINNEIDALRVMGISPIRFLVAPSLIGMTIMVPCLVVWSNFVSLFGAGIFISADLGMSLGTFFDQTLTYLDAEDVIHGLSKSVIFGILIAIIGVVNGASVSGGAEGVGRVTTRAVVHSISAIVLTDMIFVFSTTR